MGYVSGFIEEREAGSSCGIITKRREVDRGSSGGGGWCVYSATVASLLCGIEGKAVKQIQFLCCF